MLACLSAVAHEQIKIRLYQLAGRPLPGSGVGCTHMALIHDEIEILLSEYARFGWDRIKRIIGANHDVAV